MKRLPDGLLDRVRAEASIATLATRWIKWDQRKSNIEKGDFWAPCPFHAEKSASFHVDDRKRYYYCFGCQAKGDVIGLVQELEDCSFLDAVKKVAFFAGIDFELIEDRTEKKDQMDILTLKDVIVQNFEKENFLEIGVVTGFGGIIQNHDRLLRSLSWGDADYSGNVLEVLTKIEALDPNAITKIEKYVGEKFSDSLSDVQDVQNFRSSARSLGYCFQEPRKDVVGVMMPFGQPFQGVYENIKSACAATPLPAQRADEVWNDSVLINDILSLINHSAVVVCDLTGRNENVFYELGIAHAWGKTVIPITQSANDVPFDLRHHRYLTYLNNEEGLLKLKRELSSRLVGLLGAKFPF